jgi:site-specific recombinase XerD
VKSNQTSPWLGISNCLVSRVSFLRARLLELPSSYCQQYHQHLNGNRIEIVSLASRLYCQSGHLQQSLFSLDLRHTFATERVGLMGIEELRALMEHESIQTTLRYQKVTLQRAEKVAQIAFSSLPNFSE